MAIRDLFSSRELKAIREATARAEARTSGEVVSYVVGRCDDYDGAAWRAATAGAVLGAALGTWRLGTYEVWSGHPERWLLVAAVLGAVLAYVLVRGIPPLHRALIPAGDIELQVARRAAAAFVEEEIFATRERTGVLLFIAHFEHRVLVLRDTGINAKVDADHWDAIAANVADGIHKGQAAEALLAAVEACGALLEQHGVERRADDRNELDDRVRIHDR